MGFLNRVSVRVLHHLEAERRAYALDAAMHDDEAVKLQDLEAIDDRFLADTGEPADALKRGADFAILEREAQKRLEDARGGARDALLSLLAALPVDAALDHVERLQDARIGVAIDAELGRVLKGALAAIVREVRPLVGGLVVKSLHKGALLVGAALPHEVESPCARGRFPRGGAVAAARGFDGGRRGRGLRCEVGKKGRLIRGLVCQKT